MKVMIVTGLSGAGKTIALHALEDKGYFTMDNTLCRIAIFLLQNIEKGETELNIDKLALGIDNRAISSDKEFALLLQCLENITDLPSKKIFFSDAFYFDITYKKLMNDKEEIRLAKNELDLLELLSKNNLRTVSFDEIENVVWYDSVMSDNALRILVAKLRKKLPSKIIENVPKIGYKVNCL